MKKLQIQATVPQKEDKEGNVISPQIGPYTVEVDAPETFEEAGKMFGPEVVLSNALAKWVITVQNNLRDRMRKGESEETLKARFATAKMGTVQRVGAVDPIEATKSAFALMSEKEQAAYIKKLQDIAAGK